MSSNPTLPSPEHAKAEMQRLTKVAQLASQSPFHQHVAFYEGQTPSILKAVDPDELERLAGEKLDKGTHLAQTPYLHDCFIFGWLLITVLLAAESSHEFLDNNGAFWYVFGAAGRGWTHKANRAAFEAYRIIPKMLVDSTFRDHSVSLCNPGWKQGSFCFFDINDWLTNQQTTLFGGVLSAPMEGSGTNLVISGVKYPSPLILAPVGVQAIMHKDAEFAAARAAAKTGIPFCLSTAGARTIEEVARESGNGPRWYQLYWPSALLRRCIVELLT
jgi:hypothetical protein